MYDRMLSFIVALERIIGVTPALMRPPYGSYNDLVRTVVDSRNQSSESQNFNTHH